VRIRGDRQPIIGDKFCLPPDHEVLTESGFVPIETVTMSMKIAQLHEDGSYSFVRPTDVQSWLTKIGEEMISIEDEQTGRRFLKCTPRHKVGKH
jgi:hypothetical protein